MIKAQLDRIYSCNLILLLPEIGVQGDSELLLLGTI